MVDGAKSKKEAISITYEELQAKIMSMSDEQKKMHVTVCIDGEYFGVNNVHKDAFKENEAPDG